MFVSSAVMAEPMAGPSGASDTPSPEDLWKPFDLLLLKYYDISNNTLEFLTRKGFTSLEELKMVTPAGIDNLLTNPPLGAIQVAKVVHLLSEFKDSWFSSPNDYNIAMTKPHMEALEKNADTLAHLIDVNILVERLHGYQMLTERDVAKISAFETDPEKAKKLFEIIPRKPDICFLFFLQSMRDTGQGHVSDMIEKSLCDSPMPRTYTLHINRILIFLIKYIMLICY